MSINGSRSSSSLEEHCEDKYILFDNSVYKFLKENWDIFSLELLNKEVNIFENYLKELRESIIKLESIDFHEHEHLFSLYEVMRVSYSQGKGFIDLVRATIHVIAEKSYTSLNFDVETFEEYRQLKPNYDKLLSENSIYIKEIDKLRKERAYLYSEIENLIYINDNLIRDLDHSKSTAHWAGRERYGK